MSSARSQRRTITVCLRRASGSPGGAGVWRAFIGRTLVVAAGAERSGRRRGLPAERSGRRPCLPAINRRTHGSAGRNACRYRRSRRRGFTLIELLTSIAVVAILATITISALRGVKERANVSRARSDLAALSTALEEFKRHYGDYPQLGEFGQAPATPSGISPTLPNGSGPGLNTAQAKFFNCLTGVFGARAFGSPDRLNGPNLLPPQLADRKYINGTLTNTFLIPVSNTPNPPTKTEQNVSLLDPWGRRYLYYYKNARNPNNWQATGYVLFSAGPRVTNNGTQTPPINTVTGIFLPTQTAEMADNIYAN